MLFAGSDAHADAPMRRQGGRHARGRTCCLTSPVCASQIMAVLSTLPLSRYRPVEFHLREKIGPLWRASVLVSFPLADQMRAWPSYEPVASAEPLWFQSRVVTSFDFCTRQGAHATHARSRQRLKKGWRVCGCTCCWCARVRRMLRGGAAAGMGGCRTSFSFEK